MWSDICVLEDINTTKVMEGILKRKSERAAKPTQRAQEEKIRQLKALRSASCGRVTSLTNIIQGLIDTPGHSRTTIEEKIILWKNAMAKLYSVHSEYTELLLEDEREIDAETWAAPVFNGFEAARKRLEAYLRYEANDAEVVQPCDSVSHVSSRSKQSQKELDAHLRCEGDDGKVIQPCDSVSQVSSRSKRSQSSRCSSSSSIALARVDAAAKKAELLARAAALKKTKMLKEKAARLNKEMKEKELKRKEEEAKLEREREEEERKRKEIEDLLHHEQEQMNVDVELAGAEARLRALEVEDVNFEQNSNLGVQPEKDILIRSDLNPYADRFVYDPMQIPPQPTVTSQPQQPPAHCYTQDPTQQDIAQQQQNLSKLLLQAQLKSSLPRREIPIFDGNPLEYVSWLSSFNHGVEERCTNEREKLYYLEQFTGGAVKRLVRSFMQMDPRQGYRKAKEAIADRYGNKFTLARSFIQEVEKFPNIKSEDISALNDFSLQLLECKNTMESLGFLAEVNHASQIRAFVSKLPYKLRERWRAITSGIQETRTVDFADLVSFVTKHAKIAANPVYGEISNDDYSSSKSRSSGLRSGKTRPRHTRSFATSTGSTSSTSAPRAKECMYCDNASHTLEMCKKLASKSGEDKIQFLKSRGLCFGCLKEASHMRKDCTNKLSCKLCHKNHPTLLHRDKPVNDSSASATTNTAEKARQETSNSENKVTCGTTGTGYDDGSPIVIPVLVRSKDSGRTMKTYAFLDNGSDAVFCSNKLQQQLHVKGRKTQLQVKTLTGERLVESTAVAGLQVSSLDGGSWVDLPVSYTEKQIPARVGDAITRNDIKEWSHLDRVSLHEVNDTNIHVGLMIGNNAPSIMEPLETINSVDSSPFAFKTRVGWVVCGVHKQKPSSYQSVSVYRICTTEALEDKLIQMYNHDFNERLIEDHPERSKEDQRFLDIMSTSITKVNSHYQLPLPFRSDAVQFPDNRVMAVHRLTHLKRKFVKNQAFKDEYSKAMKKTIEKGYAEVAPVCTEAQPRTWYIPHHGVYHPQKQKLRVVFDCAATYRGVSLNKELLQGPDLTNSLVGVLTRFRQENVAMMADIEAMFNQVRVPEQDRDALRFLWWQDGDVDQPIKEYRMTTHLFGATSSPSCVNYALRRTGQDYSSKYKREVIDTMQQNFYVDDCLKSVPTEADGVALARDLSALCKEGGFRLTKWMSNSPVVMESIPKEEQAEDARNLSLDYDTVLMERALGLLWIVSEDKFGFKINLKDQPVTRRGILSTVSSIYDPLGMVSPAILPAKMILQDLCRLKIGWDDGIPAQQAAQWKTWVNAIPELSRFTISRCFKPANFGDDYDAQIHHFADASEKGYGTVSYIRLINTKGDVHCALLMSKARVAPLKKIFIPRMELTAATVAVRVNHMIRNELQIPIQDTYFWTDSTTVLNYIGNEKARFHTFVANRLALIHDGSSVAQWRYVPTDSNPADDCSRGLTTKSFLHNTRWTQGPEFLHLPESEWPTLKSRESSAIPNDDPEIKAVNTNATAVDESEDAIMKLFIYHSSWYKLKRSVAWILKVKRCLIERAQRLKLEQQQGTADKPALNMEDIEAAESSVIHYVQRNAFPNEIKDLMEKKHVKISSCICRLNPLLKDGLLRVGGRLRRSAMPEDAKTPVILPKDHIISQLILRDLHEVTGHGGRNYILSRLRQRFWIINANAAARNVIRKCVVCRRSSKGVEQQQMADLPSDRLTPSEPPFTRVGMDYFGPFLVKVGRSTVKRYGVIFTCLAIRAIHIEKADALDTDACLNAIRRFIARRGQVKTIKSDNGTNLVGAERELRKGIQSVNQAKIHTELLQRNVTWTFSPPTGSHHGGVWERQIRSVRKVLGSIMKQQTLTDDYLQTLFCEVEAIVNSRPITTVSEDSDDLEPLTPNHLLLMKVQPVLPPALTSKTDMYTRRRWKQVQYLADLFWRRWTKEYLPQLQQRQKWVQPKRNVQVGDVVVIVDDTQPRNSWRLGKVLETMPDRRGYVRQVRLKTQSSVLLRPISKICLLLEADS